MYHCSICSNVSTTLSASLKHANLHKHVDNFHVKCPFQNCSKTFSKIGTVYSHLCRDHREVRRAEQKICITVNIQSCDLVCSVDTCIQRCNYYKSLVAHLKSHIGKGIEVGGN
uniref:C2H2-type domain-containing protein n=1 Tax=Ixodes ricinus TaxID=34613 RepID=A0A6B0UKK5_IXORI